MKNYVKIGDKIKKPSYGMSANFIRKMTKLRRPPRLEGKVQNVGIKPVRKKPKKSD